MTIFIILLMLFFNAIFAAYEMALASISRSRMLVLLNQKKKGASEASYMKENMSFSVMLSEDVSDAEISNLRKKLDGMAFVKRVDF